MSFNENFISVGGVFGLLPTLNGPTTLTKEPKEEVKKKKKSPNIDKRDATPIFFQLTAKRKENQPSSHESELGHGHDACVAYKHQISTPQLFQLSTNASPKPPVMHVCI